ncbi:PRD domain-containing protein [Paenibacillus filicis]|uniref:PRD domain-containing protein n=1 Tax=Paenibacillus gyeongsangnamensis TaxID=3388067 RepID=A0ABT4QGT8_9BACL|nr:PRD domain-containing protein [Paenibacillus filicis]MCZ8516007.1 PRD domain-containing protein [Paenibacillus filicis]
MIKQDASLRIERIIGNNVLLAKDPVSGREYVLLGKGIGFFFKNEEWIEAKDKRIEKRFRLDDRDQLTQYQSMLEDIDPEVLQLSEQIIEQIAEEFALTVDNKVYFALPSHIQFAVHRLRNGMDIRNPFLYETQMCFPKEYGIAQKAAELISSAFNVEVPEDEIGFLAYHVHAAVSKMPVGQMVKFAALINDMVELIERRRSIRIPKESTDYVRLITHLRFSLERIHQSKVVANPFMHDMKKQYKEEYKLADELARMMEEHLNMKVPEDEIGYLVMHLYRLFESFPQLD